MQAGICGMTLSWPGLPVYFTSMFSCQYISTSWSLRCVEISQAGRQSRYFLADVHVCICAIILQPFSNIHQSCILHRSDLNLAAEQRPDTRYLTIGTGSSTHIANDVEKWLTYAMFKLSVCNYKTWAMVVHQVFCEITPEAYIETNIHAFRVYIQVFTWFVLCTCIYTWSGLNYAILRDT